MLLVGRMEDGDTELRPMKFIHPKYDKNVTYLIGDCNVYEMQIIEDKDHCSLFFDDYVSESNQIFCVSRIDPFFLLIPSLLKNRKKNQISEKFCSSPLDQLLNDNEIEHVLSKTKDLTQICAVQRIDDEIYCVLSDEKVMAFLDVKLKNIQKTLQPKCTDSLCDALAILNEYVCAYFFDMLCKKYNLSATRVINSRKRKNVSIESDKNGNSKRRKMNVQDDVGTVRFDHKLPFNDRKNNSQVQKPAVKATPKSRAISNLSKVNTKGMKSMMSYFTTKKKK